MNETTDDKASADRRWGLRFMWLIATGMFVVIVVNTAMYALAVGTFPGVVMERDDGAVDLCIANFAAARERQALGWQADLEYRLLESGRMQIDTDLIGADGQPLAGLLVSAKIWRPTHEGFDRTVTLWEVFPGRYSGELGLPLSGQWDIRLNARRGADSYERSWRIHTE